MGGRATCIVDLVDQACEEIPAAPSEEPMVSGAESGTIGPVVGPRGHEAAAVDVDLHHTVERIDDPGHVGPGAVGDTSSGRGDVSVHAGCR